MYYAIVKGNKAGVVDTKDRAFEIYTVEELNKFKKMGIKVLSESDLKEVANFLRRYMLEQSDFGGGSEFDMVLSYVVGTGSNTWGCSRYDYAKGFKDDYQSAKAVGFDEDITNLYGSKDLFIQDYIKMYGFRTTVDMSGMDYNTTEKRKAEIVEDFCKRWHLPLSFKDELVY